MTLKEIFLPWLVIREQAEVIEYQRDLLRERCVEIGAFKDRVSRRKQKRDSKGRFQP